MNSPSLSFQTATPTVSFIIPTYDRWELLSRCVQSILTIDYGSIEVLVVSDGSCDNVTNVIDSARAAAESTTNTWTIRHIVSDSCEAGTNRRLGHRYAVGQYRVFVDDDDFIIDPHYLRTAVDLMEDWDEIGAVLHNAMIFKNETYSSSHRLNQHGYVDKVRLLRGWRTSILKPLSTVPTVFKAEALDTGGANDMVIMEDSAICARCFLSAGAWFSSRYVAAYAVHSQNASQSPNWEYLERQIGEYQRMLGRLPDEINADSWFGAQVLDIIRFYFANSPNPDRDRVECFIANNAPQIRDYLMKGKK